MSEQVKQKSVILLTLVHGDVSFNLTEKGAVTVYSLSGRFIDSLKPSMVKILADVSGDDSPLKRIVSSPEFGQVKQNWEDNKMLKKFQAEEAKVLRHAEIVAAQLKALEEMKQKLKKG